TSGGGPQFVVAVFPWPPIWTLLHGPVAMPPSTALLPVPCCSIPAFGFGGRGDGGVLVIGTFCGSGRLLWTGEGGGWLAASCSIFLEANQKSKHQRPPPITIAVASREITELVNDFQINHDAIGAVRAANMKAIQKNACVSSTPTTPLELIPDSTSVTINENMALPRTTPINSSAFLINNPPHQIISGLVPGAP